MNPIDEAMLERLETVAIQFENMLQRLEALAPQPVLAATSDEALQARADYNRDNWKTLYPELHDCGIMGICVMHRDGATVDCESVVFTPYGYLTNSQVIENGTKEQERGN